jgi:hypothetical protein
VRDSAPRAAARRRGEAAVSPSGRTIGLLVTGAVVPQASPASQRRSVPARLADYRAGLESWAFYEKLGPIVVCEGSDFPEHQFRAAVSPDGGAPSFEYLSYPAPENAAGGKGRAEVVLLARALGESRSLAGVDRFLKATGRYVIRNGESLVRRILAQPALPDVQVNLHNRLTYADSRVFLFSREFFDTSVYPRRDEISDSDETWLEHVLARATLAHAAAGGDWDLLPLPLWVRGVAGTTGKEYGQTPAHYARARALHWLKWHAFGTRVDRP